MKKIYSNEQQNITSFNKIEGKLNYNERRLLDLTHQILNDASNLYQETRNISDLFEALNKSLSSDTNNDFKRSLNRTGYFFKSSKNMKSRLADLQNNNPNSFLIETLQSNNHIFACVIRKFSEDYSITVVNKGGRGPLRSQYEEFIVDKNNINPLLENIPKGDNNKKTEDIYRIIESHSKNKYKLNVMSKEQKIGNCFIKEPETAVKFAFSTRNFIRKDFFDLRNEFGNKKFTPKWNMPTMYLHYSLINHLMKKSERIAPILHNEFVKYYDNKRFRTLVDQGNDIEDSFFKTFDKFSLKFKPKKIKVAMESVNLDTIEQKTAEILTMVKKAEDPEYTRAFIDLQRYCTKKGRGRYFENKSLDINHDKRIRNLQQTLVKIEKFFPWATKQSRFQYHLDYFSKAAEYSLAKKKSEALNNINKAVSFYPYNPKCYIVKGIFHERLADNAPKDSIDVKNIKQAIESYSKAIDLNPDSGDAYRLRGLAYSRRGDFMNYSRDMKKAKELTPGKFSKVSKEDNKHIREHIVRNSIPNFIDNRQSSVLKNSLNKANLASKIQGYEMFS